MMNGVVGSTGRKMPKIPSTNEMPPASQSSQRSNTWRIRLLGSAKMITAGMPSSTVMASHNSVRSMDCFKASIMMRIPYYDGRGSR